VREVAVDELRFKKGPENATPMRMGRESAKQK